MKYRNTTLVGKPNPYEPLRINYPVMVHHFNEGYQIYDTKTDSITPFDESDPSNLFDANLYSRRLISIHSPNTTLKGLTAAYARQVENYDDLSVSIAQSRPDKAGPQNILFARIRLPNKKFIELNDTQTILGKDVNIFDFAETFVPNETHLLPRVGKALVAFQETFHQKTHLNIRPTIASTGMKIFENLLPAGRLQRLDIRLEDHFRQHVSISPILFSNRYFGEYVEYDKNAAYPDAYTMGLPYGLPVLKHFKQPEEIFNYPLAWVFGTWNVPDPLPCGWPCHKGLPGDRYTGVGIPDQYYSSEFVDYILRDQKGQFKIKYALCWDRMMFPQRWQQLVDTLRKAEKTSPEYLIAKMLANTPHGKMCSPHKGIQSVFQAKSPEEGWINPQTYFLEKLGLESMTRDLSPEEIDVAADLGKFYWIKEVDLPKAYHLIHVGALIVERHKIEMLRTLDWLKANSREVICVQTDSIATTSDCSDILPIKPRQRGYWKEAKRGIAKFTRHLEKHQLQGSQLPGIPQNARSPEREAELFQTGKAIFTGTIQQHNLTDKDFHAPTNRQWEVKED